jgi:hypothetical protein
MTPIAAATIAKATNTAPVEPTRIESSARIKKGREGLGATPPTALAAQIGTAAELLVATAYTEGRALVPESISAIVVKIVSNFSLIRMKSGGCAYRKIAFS